MPAGRHPSTDAPNTFLHGDSTLARVARPLARFLAIEASGGILLLTATVVALAWANSPWSGAYDQLWSTPFDVAVGSWRFQEDLLHVVNDGLMAVFFFVVGLEIKRQLVAGELRDRRNVALPAMAALGGMIVPAALYAAINVGGPGVRGWGIPMATDIAFALGVVAVLGARVPSPLKVFLLTLAIVDDIGAIVVIAVFYSAGVDLVALVIAAAIVAAVVGLRALRVTAVAVYVIAGLALWLTVHESGVHATIAGVVMGLLTPASACGRLIKALHPWTSYLIVPLFALANAGIALNADSIGAAPRVAIGVVVGLVVGKISGITGFAWVATRLGLARLPTGVGWRQLLGISAVAGIGFTVSLFVTGLAFEGDESLGDAARVGILVASVLAASAGAMVFLLGGRRR